MVRNSAMRHLALSALVLLAAGAAAKADTSATCLGLAQLAPGLMLSLELRATTEGQPPSRIRVSVIENGPDRRVIEMVHERPAMSVLIEGRPSASGAGPMFASKLTTTDRTGARPPAVQMSAVSEPADALSERVVTEPTSYNVINSNLRQPIAVTTVPRASPPLVLGACSFPTRRWSDGRVDASGGTVTQDMVYVPALGITYPEAARRKVGERELVTRYEVLAASLSTRP
jgi:hypothetical protein